MKSPNVLPEALSLVVGARPCNVLGILLLTVESQFAAVLKVLPVTVESRFAGFLEVLSLVGESRPCDVLRVLPSPTEPWLCEVSAALPGKGAVEFWEEPVEGMGLLSSLLPLRFLRLFLIRGVNLETQFFLNGVWPPA